MIADDKVLKLRSENKLLKVRIRALERELTLQKKREKMRIAKKIEEILRQSFTPGQMKMFMKPGAKKTHWTAEDICAAISLRSVSPKAYRYLRNVRKIPLPALSTLRKWVANFNLEEGILQDVLRIMHSKGQGMSALEKITVLCFDEISVSKQVGIEKRREQVIGPASKCQVMVVRGLFARWKQPIFYKFDQNMTKEIILDAITQLYNIGYKVVAMTSDLGSTNQALLKQFGIQAIDDDAKTYFEHPCDAHSNVHVFADVPHLMKLLRNHFLDSGFWINGHFVSRSPLEKLLQLNSGDLKIAFKLSRTHLDVHGSQRQNVKLAAQVFSDRNAAAIRWCGLQGFMDDEPEWAETARVLKLFNDWFDLFNSTNEFGKHEGLHAYGVKIEHQNKILEEVTSTVQDTRVGNSKSLLPFQKGIILSNISLKNLLTELMEAFGREKRPVSYLLTNRLNQDVIENLFGYIRAMARSNDIPTPLDFRYRLRWYILGKHASHVITDHTNTAQNIQDKQEYCLTSNIDFGFENEESAHLNDEADEEVEKYLQSMGTITY